MKANQGYAEKTSRPDLARLRIRYGLYYGMAAGFGFAFMSWAWDGYQLSLSNGYLPWVNFFTGMILCVGTGGVAGWLRARMEHTPLGLLPWLAVTGFFAWLTVALPLQIMPRILSAANPELGSLLNYNPDVEFNWFLGVGLIWIVPFMVIAGLLQSALVEPAAFSTTTAGRLTPFLAAILVMGIAGLITDGLINSRFRNATLAMNNTIQFVLDHRGQEVDAVLSRRMFAASLRTVEDYLDPERSLVVGSFDQDLGQIHILVGFPGGWVDCNVVYNQPSFCKPAVPAD